MRISRWGSHGNCNRGGTWGEYISLPAGPFLMGPPCAAPAGRGLAAREGPASDAGSLPYSQLKQSQGALALCMPAHAGCALGICRGQAGLEPHGLTSCLPRGPSCENQHLSPAGGAQCSARLALVINLAMQVPHEKACHLVRSGPWPRTRMAGPSWHEAVMGLPPAERQKAVQRQPRKHVKATPA